MGGDENKAPEDEAELERKEKIRWQIRAAGLDPTNCDPPPEGYGLDGYQLMKPKSSDKDG